MQRDLPRSIGAWGALGIMLGIIIGGGIFQTPASIARELGNPLVILALWVAGGVLTLFGALAYAELAAMFPQSGGVYVYLREGFGRAAAFVFGWTYLLISKPLGAAGVAMLFSNHLVELMGILEGQYGVPMPPPGSPLRDPRAQTIALLIALTWINARGMRLGSGLAIALTAFKFLVLLAIVFLGFSLGDGSLEHFRPSPAPKGFLAALVPVMAAILWTYDGWSDAGAVAGEVRNPGRTLPRVFFLGTAVITLVYLAVNAAYLWMIPLPEMAVHDTVAPLVMDRLLGPAAAVAVSVVILASTLGSTHGSIITGARVSYQQARDGLMFRWLGRVHPRHETPAVALWVQCGLSCLAVWRFRTFENLAGGFIFSMWIFYGLAAGAVFVLRARRPDTERPYRCPGYPVVPGIFVLSAAFMTALSVWQDVADPQSRGVKTLPWLLVLLAGWPVYVAWRRAGEHR